MKHLATLESWLMRKLYAFKFDLGNVGVYLLAALAIFAMPSRASATVISTDLISQYLLIGLAPVNDVPDPNNPAESTVGIGTSTSASSGFELGSNKAPVPSTSDFLTGGGGGGGPGLEGNVPALPTGIQAVPQGITGDGNIAVVSPEGTLNLQDIGVYADPNIGIRCAQSAATCNLTTQNSFFNDPNQFPNTFDDPGGDKIGPLEAVQSTRIDQPNAAGITENFDFSPLLAELADAKVEIPLLAATSIWDLSDSGQIFDVGTIVAGGTSSISTSMGPDGKLVLTFDLAPGPNVIDIDTDGQDLLLNNMTLIIDGFEDSFAIFRMNTFLDINFIVTNSLILAGDGLGDLNSLLFFTDALDNGGHFNFSQSIVNGIAFWSLGMSGGEIIMNNVQGCTQLVADKIGLNDIRLSRCAFSDRMDVPEPSTLTLFGIGLAVLGFVVRRRRSIQPKAA